MTRERALAVLAVVREEEVTFLAAAIAYYAFVSVLPALLLAVVVASTLGGPALVEAALTATGSYLTPTGQDLLGDAIRNARGRAGATLVGVAVLAWTTLRVFRGLDVAFSRIYGTSRSVTFLTGVRNAAAVVVSMGVGIAGMLAAGAVLAALLPARGDAVGLVALLAGLVVVFLPLYYVFPDADVGLGETVPGAVAAAVGWVALQALFQVYAAAAPAYELYGVIGAILLLVTWFYLAAIVILVGAAVNVVLAGRDRQVQHA